MAYTPTNWSTGDTITASDMNKLENAVANIGGNAVVRISASGFAGSASHFFGYIVYGYRESDTWVLFTDVEEDWHELYGNNAPNDRVAIVNIPKSEDFGVFIVDQINDEKTITGNISSMPTTLYYGFGSVFVGNNRAYRITGDGSFTFVAT